MPSRETPKRDTWEKVIEGAFRLFDDLEDKGFGAPPFSLGGGTVLMLQFQHRLSKDIDFFGYDAQWLSLLSPRLNEFAAAMATDYTERANSIKIVMPHGDIDFIVSADVVPDLRRQYRTIHGRKIQVDPTAEILAKKLYYRASDFKARDVYDMSAAIDLDALSAHIAVFASKTKSDLLIRRLDELARIDEKELTEGIVPFDDQLRHSAKMIEKVNHFITSKRDVSTGKSTKGNPGNER